MELVYRSSKAIAWVTAITLSSAFRIGPVSRFFLGLATRFPQLSLTGCEANKTVCDPFTVLWLRAQERKYEALAVGADVIPATLLTDCAG